MLLAMGLVFHSFSPKKQNRERKKERNNKIVSSFYANVD